MRTLKAVMVVGYLSLAGAGFAFDLQGHRGARGLAPENTLPAFATALSLGVTTLELDAGITKDGVVVISHDSALNPDITRGKDGKWLEERGPAVYSLTFTELQGYDVGRLKPNTGYARNFPDQKAADGTRIPRLADLFALVRRSGNGEVRFNIETKLSPLKPDEAPDPEGFVKALIELIRKEGMESRVSIQSFDWRTLQAVKKIASEIPTVCLTAQQRFLDNISADTSAGSAWTAGYRYRDYGSVPKMVKAAGGGIWSPYFGDLTEANLKEAHDLGLKVVVWTVNDPVRIKKMLDLGVDGLISDRPDLVRRVMGERGMTLPTATPVQP